MSNQLRLFAEDNHLEPDCFFSGDPLQPDPMEARYVYWNGIENVPNQRHLFLGRLAYNGNDTGVAV